MILLKGIPVSRGIALEKAYILPLEEDATQVQVGKSDSRETEPVLEEERKRFQEACEHVACHLRDTRARVAARLGENEAEIFEAQLLLLEDDVFLEAFEEELTKGKLLAEDALRRALACCEGIFLAMESVELRQRVVDLRDVWRHVLSFLQSGRGVERLTLSEDVILVGRELYPSFLANLELAHVKGIVTERGGAASHITVLAHAMNIPYIIGTPELSRHIQQGDPIALDGEQGEVYICPDQETTARLGQAKMDWMERLHALRRFDALPAKTLCGQEMTLRANVGFLREIDDCKKNAVQGVGLFRTEFLYMGRDALPSEEEQYALYRRIVEDMAPELVTFRTLDIGGDKRLASFPLPMESNPHLGWRGVRISLDHYELLLPQFQAMLRAGLHGRLRIMIPMLSAYEELQAVRQLFQEAQDGLRKRGVPFAEDVPLGIMVETPAAALSLSHWAREVDFLSVGTNDLIQFLMAADRNNARVNHLFSPMQPSLLRLLQIIVNAAQEAKIPLSLCGEMAGKPLFLPLLLGLGFRELSMSPRQVGAVKRRMRLIRVEETDALMADIWGLPSSAQVYARLKAFKAHLLRSEARAEQDEVEKTADS
ncbi:MAG: phosphoenolpyruvate--protein phosphotransferase [Myxococcales bacterium]|nr:phosphoenolpyruvate--protein phosphotransferase [Myxococcales bacterium]